MGEPKPGIEVDLSFNLIKIIIKKKERTANVEKINVSTSSFIRNSFWNEKYFKLLY